MFCFKYVSNVSNYWQNYSNSIRPSTSASFRVTSQPMKILEIPPYRKNQLNQNPTAIVNPSPPRIPEIPTFKSKKSNDWQPNPIDNSNQEFQQLHIPAAMNSDLVRRLKSSESAVHHSTDCIVTGSKAENLTPSDATMKVAPSCTNVAQRSESISSTTGAVQTGGSKKASIDDETKGKLNSYAPPPPLKRISEIPLLNLVFFFKYSPKKT